MKLLRNITAKTVEETSSDIGGTRAQLHLEVSPGVFIHVSLSPDYLAFTQGDRQAAFLIPDLLAAAKVAVPMLGNASAPTSIK